MLGGKQTKNKQKRKKTTKKERYSCEKVRLKEIIKWVKKKNQALVVLCHSKYLFHVQLF